MNGLTAHVHLSLVLLDNVFNGGEMLFRIHIFLYTGKSFANMLAIFHGGASTRPGIMDMQLLFFFQISERDLPPLIILLGFTM